MEEVQAEFVGTTERSLKEVEEALLKGDSVTTRELRIARRHFKQLRESLGDLGQRWHFSFQEANRLWALCDSYLKAREKSF